MCTARLSSNVQVCVGVFEGDRCRGRGSCALFELALRAGDEVERWAPFLSPLLLAVRWRHLELAWGAANVDDAVRRYAAGEPLPSAAPLLGAYLQLNGLPALPVLRRLAADALARIIGVGQDAASAQAAAAALLAAQHSGLTPVAAQALIASLAQ